jgi:Sporulation protein YtfJ (Spore_YtfJ)
LGAVRRLVTALGGARLCYGEPVRVGEHTVIPVARVRAVGGGGFGAEGQGRGDGGGGGGLLDAAPVGFIAVSRDGVRFEPIPDPAGRARALRTGLGALTGLAGAVAASRAVRRRRPAALRSPRRLLPR